MISLKSPREIDAMEKAGAALAAMHLGLRKIIKPGISSWKIEEFARKYFKAAGANKQEAVKQAQNNLDNAEKLAQQATPENIKQTRKNISDQQKVIQNAQGNVNDANTELNRAQDQLNNGSDSKCQLHP